ncbi:MAG: hypothetical protein ACTSRE_13175, partial [Promethearchaeota archaeon]
VIKMKKITPRTLMVISLAMIIPMAVMIGKGNFFAGAQTAKTDVLYVGGDQGSFLNEVIRIDKENIVLSNVDASFLTSGNLPDYDVVVLNDVNLTAAQITDLTTWAAVDGHGVFIILGNDTLENDFLSAFGFTDDTSFDDNLAHAPVDPLNPWHGLSNINGDLEESPFTDIPRRISIHRHCVEYCTRDLQFHSS